MRKTAIAGLLLIPVVAGGFMLQASGRRESARLLEQVMTLVSTRYVDTLSGGGVYEKAAAGLVNELHDPYSELLPPKQFQTFSTRTAGKYGGVGMLIEDQNGSITVSRVFPHTPAEEAGAREGDRIIAVDTLSTRGWKVGQVSEYMQGAPGSTVSVRFQRPGVVHPITVRFTRATIHIPAVPYALMLEPKIGYVPVQQFNETATEEVSAAIGRLTTEGARAFVLDLRDNPGGILDQALSLTNVFLREGQQVASIRMRTGESRNFVAPDKPLVPTAPLIVLTDGQSASASEIVAGALQDHDRALILGTTSFGKGLVQSVFPLEGGYALKLTTAKWYTPSGRSIQKERKRLATGELVEVLSDSLETDSVKKARPSFRSDAARIVYGGGGITPDVIVKPDTITTVEQQLMRAFAPKLRESYVALYDLALTLRPKVRSPAFSVDPAWRDDYFQRLTTAGVPVERKQFDASAGYIDRLISNRLTQLAFGDSAAKRRDLSNDSQLMAALSILRSAQTQKELFTIAQQRVSAPTPVQRVPPP